jgi:uncharacterized protein (DUF58 family)
MTTRSFWVLSGLFGLMVITGLITVNNTLIVLACPLIIYLMIAVFFAPCEVKLQVRRFLSTDRINEGMDITVSIQVDNENARIDELHLYELSSFNSQSLEGGIFKVVQLNPGESIKYKYTFQGLRGNYSFEGLVAWVTDPFGMFETRDHLPASGKVLVFPEVTSLNAIPIQPPLTKGFSGPIPSHKSGAGMDFFGVRQYQLGDSLRRVNWKISARHTENLYTNEYEQERIADVGLILDARPHCDLSFKGRRLFEYSVHAVASLATMFLDEGHCLSLLVYGDRVSRVFPGYGQVQCERVLEALTLVETGINYVTEYLFYFPARLLPPRGQLLYISPLATSDLEPMKRFRDLGYAVLIISPDPLFFEQQIESDPSQPDFQLAKRFAKIERDLLISNLRKSGIQVANWKVDQPLSEVVDKVRIQYSNLQRTVKVLQ